MLMFAYDSVAVKGGIHICRYTSMYVKETLDGQWEGGGGIEKDAESDDVLLFHNPLH